MVSFEMESSRAANDPVNAPGMCCTITIGGNGGFRTDNMLAKAGGPPVEIAIAIQLSLKSPPGLLVLVVVVKPFFGNRAIRRWRSAQAAGAT